MKIQLTPGWKALVLAVARFLKVVLDAVITFLVTDDASDIPF